MENISILIMLGQLHPTHIDIPLEAREQLIALLGQSMSTAFDLQSQAKQAHWNVKGPTFYQSHLLFDELAGELGGYVDTLAERINALGGTPLGTIRSASSLTILPEFPFTIVDASDFFTALVERYGIFSSHLHKAAARTNELADLTTSDIYTGISQEVDKRLWFLEAHITKI